jgi:hypothetical protein
MVRTSHEESKRMVDTNCDAHLMIDSVQVTTQYGTQVECEMSILGCTDPAQVGKTIKEFFKVEGKAAGMFLNLAEAAGLITAEQRKAAHDQGVGMEIDETQLKGRQICASIKMELKLRKNPVTGQNEPDPENPGPFPKIGFNTFGVWSKKAEGIPKDQQFLAMVPKPAGAAVTAGQQVAKPSPSPAPQQQAQQAQQPAQGSLPLTGPAMPAMDW